mmetsp:Transcript_52698/g.44183  ORF Transcript_52698/g.44183 Transcript_52698/m.44183 type:complete len:92 (-) Transcript_52698:147-422(-)
MKPEKQEILRRNFGSGNGLSAMSAHCRGCAESDRYECVFYFLSPWVFSVEEGGQSGEFQSIWLIWGRFGPDSYFRLRHRAAWAPTNCERIP